MKNGLYIVSTPIGNLGDISSRAIKTLGESDIIICENPKHSLKLLSKLDIKKKLISLHDYNEESVIEKIKDHLDNKKLSLISDAGSPLISDPGYKLVRHCVLNNIYVTLENEITGCMDSVGFKIDVQGIPTIHNVFTPNGDNVNDFFDFEENAMQEISVEIYNRWGLLIHVTKGYIPYWDGRTMNGKVCSDGVYYWIFNYGDISGGEYKTNGYVHLVR